MFKCAGTAFISGTQIQGMVVLNNPDYVYERWHGTMLSMGVAAFSVFFNIFLARRLPVIEGVVLIIHICAFIGIIVTVWVLAPLSDATTIFTGFRDNGWSSLGGSTLVGITAAILPLLGANGAVQSVYLSFADALTLPEQHGPFFHRSKVILACQRVL